jgi:hypothetical protein
MRVPTLLHSPCSVTHPCWLPASISALMTPRCPTQRSEPGWLVS